MNAIEDAIEALDLEVVKISELPESHSSIVRVLTLVSDERVVIKIPQSDKKLAREYRALSISRDCELTPIPLVQRTEPRALLMAWLPGRPLLAPACTSDHARQIGAALASIHANSEGRVEPIAEGWWEVLRANAREHLKLCRKLGGDRDWDRSARVFGRSPEFDPDVFVLVHFDFRLGNLLFDGDRLCGVVDFESSRPGDAAFDFAKISEELWPLRHPELRDATLEGYSQRRALPRDWSSSLPLYALYEALSRVAWCVKNDKRGTPFFHASRDAVSRHVDGLS